ncbi:MAG: adenosylcobalamin-dependent ribonucleoside-diphosphate reductase [Nanoarchaeota archaeon]
MPPIESQQKLVKKIVKRDGRIADFDVSKIENVILKAAQSATDTGMDISAESSRSLALKVQQALTQQFSETMPTTENIQDLVEKIVIEEGHVQIGKAFILYRHKKDQERERRALILGGEHTGENLDFSNEALKILQKRYLLRDDEGKIIETPKGMLRRVARNIAQADAQYEASKEEIKETEEKFYKMMAELKFLPNSPTLSNAGTKTQQLNACFVLPIEDNMESIFGTLRDAAVIHQRAGGTGFSFSKLRPQNDKVRMHLGVASGPVSFLRVYDAALDIVKQGGIRPGANMAVMRVDHPDIMRFIEAKRDKGSLKNFNISVAITDRFMKAVEEDREYFIKNPRTEKYFGKLRAKDVFAVITQNAWKTGDPGLLFIDEINRKHPGKHLGEIETTNQCGELPLLSYESAPLGSIDVSRFVWDESEKDKGRQKERQKDKSSDNDEKEGKESSEKERAEKSEKAEKSDNAGKKELDWDALGETVRTAVHFLDNVIDMTKYPLKESERMSKETRKFGVGIMGFADMLIKLKIKYDSDEGLAIGDKLMSFIKDAAYAKSMELAGKKGTCPAWKGSDHHSAERKMRNMSCLSLSPTGTRSILANTSAGCEPLFAICYQRTTFSNTEFAYINPTFEKIARERGFYSPELIRNVIQSGSIQSFKEIPKDVRDIFVTAQDISPEWHIKMQATLQKHVDNSISKTINFPSTAAIKDVEDAYMLAWKAKCKGITIYRDGSYENQVITIGEGM